MDHHTLQAYQYGGELDHLQEELFLHESELFDHERGTQVNQPYDGSHAEEAGILLTILSCTSSSCICLHYFRDIILVSILIQRMNCSPSHTLYATVLNIFQRCILLTHNHSHFNLCSCRHQLCTGSLLKWHWEPQPEAFSYASSLYFQVCNESNISHHTSMLHIPSKSHIFVCGISVYISCHFWVSLEAFFHTVWSCVNFVNLHICIRLNRTMLVTGHLSWLYRDQHAGILLINEQHPACHVNLWAGSNSWAITLLNGLLDLDSRHWLSLPLMISPDFSLEQVHQFTVT